MNDSITFTTYGETYTAYPVLARYHNGRLAISLVSDEDGPIATITANVPDQHLNPGEVFVKTWSENEAIVAVMVEAGWLEYAGREVTSGYVNPEVMRPTGRLAELIEEYNS